MTDEISPELFHHLVELAALELSPEEGEYLRRQMNNQLVAIRELVSIPVDDEIPIVARGITYTPEMMSPIRKDEWFPFSEPGRLIDQAPEADDGYIVVPEIPHKDLD